ncbi:MAG TPA: AlkA N-terminal domain-containing protein [Candidatus Eisenbacteria bacterium]|nr:AlkA N-terminal domain-containing protein [Candidatus Eisenbacteria bacterium]
MELDPHTCWRAFAARDRRFDGRFVTGVLTTGIYCRPACPAPRPRPRNVRFFACAAAAEEAGFRPCLRCRPEAAPGTPAWLGTSATVSRALRLIGDGHLDAHGVDDLAARLGVGARHLRRLFDQQLGASPVAIARTRRVHFARRLLDQTDLPITEIALASGFNSLRRFNHTMRDTFRRPPRALRRERGRIAPEGGGLALRVPYRPPLDWPALLAFLGARAIPGVEHVERGVYRRTFRTPGASGTLEVRPVPCEPALALTLDLERPAELIQVVERVTRLFDLGADPALIRRQLARDPRLARALAGRRGVRVPGAWEPFELAVRAILGQQVSVAAARTLAGRVAEQFGEPLPAARAPLARQFPTPAALADADLTRVGVTRARAEAIRGLARAVRDGALEFARLGGVPECIARLTALPGVGEWTAHYIAMRGLGEPDAFPAGDLGVRRALADGGPLPATADLARRAETWRPWRAYAVMALWTESNASNPGGPDEPHDDERRDATRHRDAGRERRQTVRAGLGREARPRGARPAPPVRRRHAVSGT